MLYHGVRVIHKNLKTMTQFIFGHVSAETAYITHNYPWGFRLKTDKRDWIETVKGKGDRHCSQTLNPKTNTWCAVKKSTYHKVLVFYIDATTGYLRTHGLGLWETTEDCNKLIEAVGKENLLPLQLHELNKRIAFNKAMENVTFSFETTRHEPINLSDRSPENKARIDAEVERQEARKQQNNKVLGYINHVASEELKKLEG